MERYNIRVNHGGKKDNQVFLPAVPVPEIILLHEMHTPAPPPGSTMPMETVMPGVEVVQPCPDLEAPDHSDLRQELAAKYGGTPVGEDQTGEQLIQALFGGYGALPVELDRRKFPVENPMPLEALPALPVHDPFVKQAEAAEEKPAASKGRQRKTLALKGAA